MLAAADWVMRNGPRLCRYSPLDPQEARGVAHMYSIVDSRQRYPFEHDTLSSLLRTSHAYDATNSRDKLFGVLGLLASSSVNDDRIIQSITYDNTIEEIFSAAIKAAIMNDNGLLILHHISHRDHAYIKAPSAPTWAYTDVQWEWDHDPLPLDRSDTSFSGHVSASIFNLDNEHLPILRLRGWQVDTVSSIVVSFTFEDFCDVTVAAQKLLTAFDIDLTAGNDIPGYILSTLLSEQTMEDALNAPTHAHPVDEATRTLEQMQDPEEERERQIMHALWTAIAKTCINRCLFWTQEG